MPVVDVPHLVVRGYSPLRRVEELSFFCLPVDEDTPRAVVRTLRRFRETYGELGVEVRIHGPCPDMFVDSSVLQQWVGAQRDGHIQKLADEPTVIIMWN